MAYLNYLNSFDPYVFHSSEDETSLALGISSLAKEGRNARVAHLGKDESRDLKQRI